MISDLNAEFIARMEAILALYQRPYDPLHPVICFDERPCQLIQDVVQPLAMKPGKSRKEHYSYDRRGSCSAFVAFEPLQAFRKAEIFERRSKVQYAIFIKSLVEHYPKAKIIHIIQDNLSTHTKGAFYEAFPAKQAFDLAQKIQFHFTPVRASWLNMVEIELSVLARLCLKRRIPSIEKLASELKQLVKERNQNKASVNWQFSINSAREKFEKRYRQIN